MLSYRIFKYISYVSLCVAAIYGGGWITGLWPGDAEMLLTYLVLFCGVYWAMNRWIWEPERHRLLGPQLAQATPEEREELLLPDIWVSNTSGSFIILLIVWSFRSFLWEPFYVPSGSMLPTLRTGDVIAVNKWDLGIRIPSTNVWLTGPHVNAGDPIIFIYPEDPTMHFVKRIVALGGDTIVYENKTIRINAIPLQQEPKTPSELQALHLGHESSNFKFFSEKPTAQLSYFIQIDPDSDSEFEPTEQLQARWPDACTHSGSTVVCKVPFNHAFVMGDNRDNSLDSRFWGFVPYDSIKGKASRYVFNIQHFGTSRWFESIH